MGEVIDPTWVAYASGRPIRSENVEAGIDRVAGHYRATAAGELSRHAWQGDRVGAVCLTDSARTAAWPAFADGRGRSVISGYVPTGWRRLTRSSTLTEAALELGDAVAEDPVRAIGTLDSPFVIVVADRRSERLLICNDAVGAGRLYRAEAGEVTAWSNRLGALSLFLGTAPEPDPGAWRLFAAMGWFVGSATPIRGATRVPPGTVTRAGAGEVEVEVTDAIAALVAADRGRGFAEGIEEFEAEAAEAARATVDIFPRVPRVDVSGGRDSRLAAAVYVANRIPARFITSDLTPGEADVATDLFARLEADFDHRIVWSGEKRKVYEKGLMERALAVHRVHDGMRHAAKVRGKMTLPPRYAENAEISGHGGEIAHGFYYTTAKQLESLLAGGSDALVDRLQRAARRRHAGATTEAYALAREECAAALARGRAYGVSGPALLDWFYLIERFAHRSGLAADTQRITFFSCRGFLRAAFSMSPEDRLENRLHRVATAKLVPEWADVPYFAGKPKMDLRAKLLGRWRRVEKRPMIWEGADGVELERMIADEGPWTELYDRARVREIWRLATTGRADPHFQDVLEGIAYREAFEGHLRILAAAAGQGPPLTESLGAPA